jgi:hypothetical protein
MFRPTYRRSSGGHKLHLFHIHIFNIIFDIVHTNVVTPQHFSVYLEQTAYVHITTQLRLSTGRDPLIRNKQSSALYPPTEPFSAVCLNALKQSLRSFLVGSVLPK